MTSRNFPVGRAVSILRLEARHWRAPVTSLMAARGADPFLILVSALLSARTNDKTTAIVTERLFRRVKSPRTLSRMSVAAIRNLIYPVGFYKTKARHLKALATLLIKAHGGKVPSDIDALLALPGVGRKTANLVVAEAFCKPGICVDTHVHRITNRWGYVRTKNPLQTERALRAKLPKRLWIPINPTLVAFGQTICKPVSPLCSMCPVRKWCPRIGVTRSR